MPETTRIEKVSPHKTSGNWVDLKLGYALLRDHRVPLRFKAAALAIGLATVAVLAVFELPVEGVIAAVLPLIGIAGDVVFDGFETFVVPILVACLLLPSMAPSKVVAQVRRERSPSVGPSEGPIIDV